MLKKPEPQVSFAMRKTGKIYATLALYISPKAQASSAQGSVTHYRSTLP